MDPKYFRRYADLITEAESTPATPVDEGFVDAVKQGVQKASTAVRAANYDRLAGRADNADDYGSSNKFYADQKVAADRRAKAAQLRGKQPPVDEGFSNYDGTELNFYHVVVDFLIEANTPEEARKKVTEYNFAKVQERGNGWHNFDVIKVKQTRDAI